MTSTSPRPSTFHLASTREVPASQHRKENRCQRGQLPRANSSDLVDLVELHQRAGSMWLNLYLRSSFPCDNLGLSLSLRLLPQHQSLRHSRWHKLPLRIPAMHHLHRIVLPLPLHRLRHQHLQRIQPVKRSMTSLEGALKSSGSLPERLLY